MYVNTICKPASIVKYTPFLVELILETIESIESLNLNHKELLKEMINRDMEEDRPIFRKLSKLLDEKFIESRFYYRGINVLLTPKTSILLIALEEHTGDITVAGKRYEIRYNLENKTFLENPEFE